MSSQWIAILGIVASLGLATGGYEIVKHYHAPTDGLGPAELFSVSILLKAAGEFLLFAGVLMALLLGGIVAVVR